MPSKEQQRIERERLQDISDIPPRNAVHIKSGVGKRLYFCEPDAGIFESIVVFENNGRVKLQHIEKDGSPYEDCPPEWLRKGYDPYFTTKREAIIEGLISDIEHESQSMRCADQYSGIAMLVLPVECLWRIHQGEDAVAVYEELYHWVK